MKICTKCKKELHESKFGKLKSSFDGLRYVCKQCRNTTEKEYYLKDKKQKFRNSKYKKNHKEKIVEYNNQYRKTHKQEQKNYRKINKEKLKKRDQKYYQENKDKIKERIRTYRQLHKKEDNIYRKNKKEKNLNYRILCNLRSSLCDAIKNKPKKSHMLDYLGCSIEEFLIYFDSLFLENMSWENYGRGFGKWNIDHILPCASFDLTQEENIYKCFNYKNLQPLWSIDNSSKQDKIDWIK
jgi:hypothetical protein